jgi:hypothetical protein
MAQNTDKSCSSDTPRTDAAIKRGECGPDLCRQIECELGLERESHEVTKRMLADAQDDVARLHREKMDALFGPDGSPRSANGESAGTQPGNSGVKGPTAAALPSSTGWISAKDRLPEPEEWVLACALSQEACMYIAEVIDGKWHDVDGGEIDWVHHWMPLPEAPK